MSEFGEASYPNAQKDYRCEWCGETIRKGAKHPHFVGMWDGEFQGWRMHPECYEVAGENDYLRDGFMPWSHERPVLTVKE